MNSCDVAIVGAGLAGLETARLLAEAGLEVVLIDRKESLFEKIHTTGIFVRRTFAEFDLPEEGLGDPIRHIVLKSPSGKSLPLTASRDEFRVGKMGVLYSALLEKAQEAGVAWWPLTSFTGLDVGEDHTTLILKSDGEVIKLEARYVVAADGATSKVAPALGLEENTKWIVGAETVRPSSLAEASPHFDLTVDAKLAPGYLAWVVDDGHERHIGVAGAGENYQPAEQLR